MKHFVTIIVLIITLNCFGQSSYDRAKISKQTQRIVAKIEKVNELMSSTVYSAGVRPPQYDNFTELQKTATQSELMELTSHSNGVVRCYAFWALSLDDSVSLLPIVIDHIGDTAMVKTQFGCIGSREKVGDFFISIVTPQYVDVRSKKLTPAEYDYLDSILIYTPNNLSAKENAISRAKSDESLYKRVRELVLKENNQSALVTLAEFKREQDIPLILNNKLNDERDNRLFFTYRAISKFPDNAFLPFLRKSLYEAISDGAWSTEWRELYRAIASFRNDTALQLLKVPFTKTKHENIRQYHIDFIFGAVQDFYTPIYDELLWAIWENEKRINAKVFYVLYLSNPDKAFDLTKKTIKSADDIYFFNTGSYGYEDETPVNLLAIMLDTVLARDRPYAIQLINRSIRENNVHQFPTFADKALELGDTSFVSSFFERLKTEDNPHVYLKATEVLIALKDREIDRRLVELAKTNPAMRKGWGGVAFSELLKENGIK